MNIWGANKGVISIASKTTLCVTGGATVIFFSLWFLYQQILLRIARNKHVEEAGHFGLGKHGEGRILQQEPVVGGGTQLANGITGALYELNY